MGMPWAPWIQKLFGMNKPVPPIPMTGPFNEAPGEHWLQPVVDAKNEETEAEPPRVGETVGRGMIMFNPETEREVQLIARDKIDDESYYILGQRIYERIYAGGKKVWMDPPYFVVGIMRLTKYDTRIWEWEILTKDSQRLDNIFTAVSEYADIQDDWGL